jgi:uncharacterized protein (TIGR02646 family)
VIKVNKPDEVPQILQKRGLAAVKELCQLYNEDVAYRQGTKVFEFKNQIYRDKTVKKVLVQCKSGQCWFCESPVIVVDHGDVEHFRPKGGYQQDCGEEQPGYYWLAYSWENLLFSCKRCNQEKTTYFPLFDPQKRARSHQADINEESPILINPAMEDPTEYIAFRGEMAVAKGSERGRERGQRTIEILGLNRDGLVERRQDIYREKKSWYQMIQNILIADVGNKQPSADAELQAFLIKNLEEWRRPNQEYGGMLRSAIEAEFRF